MSRWNLAWLVGIPAVALLGLTIASSAPQRDKDRDYELVHLVVDVLDEVDRNYVRELDPELAELDTERSVSGPLRTITIFKIWPFAGLFASRRPDSNRGPLHYE